MSSYSYKRPDGTVRTVSGYRKPTTSWLGKLFGATRVDVEKLPPRVDLRPAMTAIEDQESTNSCVANAVAGAFECLVKRHRGDDGYDVSRLFLYYVARVLENDGDPREKPEVVDEGTSIGFAIDALKRFGACAETTWPFAAHTVNEPPSDEAFDEAATFLVEDVEKVPTELQAWKAALAEGNPIIFGVSLFESFDSHRRPGVVPSPSRLEASRADHGGHAMLCVGYSDRDAVFLVRNSWGVDWGDQGYCYIPYAYLMNPRYNDGDSWILRRVDEPPIDESTWEDDGESIIASVDGELAAMSDEDHAAMRDAMGDLPFETRLAALLFLAAAADGEVDDEETAGIERVLGEIHEAFGIALDPAKVLARAIDAVANADHVFGESIKLFAEHVPARVLAAIVAAVQEIAPADTEDEESILADFVQAWQVQRPEDLDDDESGDDEESGDDAESDEEDGEDDDEEE